MVGSSEATAVGHSRGALVGDACLLTAGVFCALSAILGAIIGLGLAAPLGSDAKPGIIGAAMQGLATVLMFGGMAVGPLGAWLLHRRPVSWAALLGAILGFVAGVAGVQGLVLVLVFVGRGVGSLTGVEVAGPITVMSILIIGFLAMTAWLDIDAVRDLAPGRREHPRLDIARLAATAAFVILVAVTIGLQLANPRSEVGEAGAFAVAAGAFAAVLVWVADLVTRFAERRGGSARAQPEAQ